MVEFIENHLLIKYKKNWGLNFRRTNKDWFLTNNFEKYWDKIINQTEFLNGVSLSERLYCIVNGIEGIILCPICGESRSFKNFTEGYRLTCGKKSCYIEAKATLKNDKGETPNERTGRIYKEKYLSDEDFILARSNKMRKTRIRNNSFSSGAIKSAKTKENTFLDNGLNISENASKKASETMRTQIGSDGKTILQRRIEKMCKTKEVIGEDGLDGYERSFKNGAGRNSSLAYYNTNLFYQGSFEKRFLDKMTEIGLIDKVKRGPRVTYKNIDGKSRQYRSDFIIDNVVYEIKSRWTYDNCGTNKKRRITNKLKLRALKREGYDVIMVCDNNHITFSKLIRQKLI